MQAYAYSPTPSAPRTTAQAGYAGYPGTVASPPPFMMYGGQHMMAYAPSHFSYPGALYPGHPGAAAYSGYPGIPKAAGQGDGTHAIKPKPMSADGKDKMGGQSPSGSGDDGFDSGTDADGDGAKGMMKRGLDDAGMPGGAAMVSAIAPPGAMGGGALGQMPAGAAGQHSDYWQVQAGAAAAAQHAAAAAAAAAAASMHQRKGADPNAWLHDERESKRQKRKQSNRESARRSRLRKQAECEELGGKVSSLEVENGQLRGELEALRQRCLGLQLDNGVLATALGRAPTPPAPLLLRAPRPAAPAARGGGRPGLTMMNDEEDDEEEHDDELMDGAGILAAVGGGGGMTSPASRAAARKKGGGARGAGGGGGGHAAPEP